MKQLLSQYGCGWIPDPKDERDLTVHDVDVHDLLQRIGLDPGATGPRPLPTKVDHRSLCPPVQFQGFYQTCTAHVVAGMLAYMENRAYGEYQLPSRLFLYQVTKRFLGESGDPGVYLRQTLGTAALLGVPDEKYYPYLTTSTDPKAPKDPRLDSEPDAFCYAVARDHRALQYYRLDASGQAPDKTLESIRSHIASGIPSSLGFPTYKDPLMQAVKSGEIPLPTKKDVSNGAHAVMIVGYDDKKVITNSDPDGESTTGAFLIRNCWTEDWGEKGYGWLPYKYLLMGHASDCWIIQKVEWVDTNQFQLGLDRGAGAGG